MSLPRQHPSAFFPGIMCDLPLPKYSLLALMCHVSSHINGITKLEPGDASVAYACKMVCELGVKGERWLAHLQ